MESRDMVIAVGGAWGTLCESGRPGRAHCPRCGDLNEPLRRAWAVALLEAGPRPAPAT